MVWANRIQLIAIGICLILSSLPKYGLTQTTGIDSTLSWMKLQCEFPDLNVYIDNTFMGKTPLPEQPLLKGEHTIRVQSPEPLNWLSRDWTDTIRIHAGENLTIRVQFNHTCWIGSTPTGAQIYAGKRLIGKTPTAVTLSDTTMPHLTLEHPGYQSHTVDLTVQGSSIVHVVLEKNSTCGSIKPNKNYSLDSKKYWMIGSGIFALASGIAGYHYKDRAEKAYQAYLKSGDPEQMEHYFDDSKKYDIRSGILYGIGEIFLGITIYLAIRGTSKD